MPGRYLLISAVGGGIVFVDSVSYLYSVLLDAMLVAGLMLVVYLTDDKRKH